MPDSSLLRLGSARGHSPRMGFLWFLLSAWSALVCVGLMLALVGANGAPQEAAAAALAAVALIAPYVAMRGLSEALAIWRRPKE